MSRILILANDYKTLANFRTELIERFIADKHEVFLSLPEDERNRNFEQMGCKIVTVPITRHGTNPLKELKLIRAYKKQMKQIHPDCVLTFTVKPNIYGSIAAASLNIPYVNNITGLGSVMQSESLLKKVMMKLQKYAYRKSSCVFFQNQGNLQYFTSKGIVKKNAALLPGSGVNLKLHNFSEYPSETPFVDFVIVSRLRKDKGFDEFFAMVEKILPKYDHIRFHIVGWIEEDHYREILKNYENESRVIYHGETTQAQVHEILHQCHCLIHPSYHEGMANVIMEASAAGRPVLASDIYGCKEGVEVGNSGDVFAVQNAQSLTDCVERYIRDSEETHRIMGKNARNKMEKEFDREIVIEKYLQQIDQITAKK